MEEFHGSAGALTGPEDHDTPAPLDAGRLGGFLCQLERQRFDGLLHITSGEHAAAIGFREGAPVTYDDPTPGHTLAEQLIERGQLTRAQCNSVLAHMTDALVEDETVAFFEHAVQLGFLTEDEANVELSSRIRARMIQLFAWRGCETTLELGSASLLGRREFPQSLGAILYMGVRTFYEEDFLTSATPDPAHTFVKLTAAPATISHYFGLDDEEFQLLRRIHPEQSLSQLFQDPRVDRVHMLGLVLLMRLSQLCEVAKAPFSRQASPRATPAKVDNPQRGKTGSYAGPLPEAESSPSRVRTGSYAGPLPDDESIPKRGRTAGSYAGPLPEAESSPLRGKTGSHVGPLPEGPGGNPLRGKTGSHVGPLPEGPGGNPLRGKTGSHVGPLPEPQAPAPLRGHGSDRSRAGSMAGDGPMPDPAEPNALRSSTGALPEAPDAEWLSTPGKAGPSVGPLPDPPAPRPGAKPSVDATQEALLEAAARTARMRRSVPSRRNSKHAEPIPASDSGNRVAVSGGPSEAPSSAGSGKRQAQAAAASSGRSPSDAPAPANTNQQGRSIQPQDPRADYAKAHLKELIARRKQTANAPESTLPNARDTARELREARSLLHAQNYARAEKLLGALVELDPQDEVFRTYHLWARWRAQPEAGEALLGDLQELAKKLLSQAEHAAFAAYALGHVFFHLKRDELAEKFFKRAHAADRTNKDAERHLLILERRKQAAAEGSAGANRKLFGIQLPSSKPKS